VWGTFLPVLVAAGGGVIGATAYGGDLTLATKALAPGVMVMAIIFFMGTISGARLNPAVTLASRYGATFLGAAYRDTSPPRSSVLCLPRGSSS
jgi:glycerol uptake facilitator-like aquaporin